jgi:hypothetical protein
MQMEAGMNQRGSTKEEGVPRRSFPWETWTALIAFALAALFRSGFFKHFPW